MSNQDITNTTIAEYLAPKPRIVVTAYIHATFHGLKGNKCHQEAFAVAGSTKPAVARAFAKLLKQIGRANYIGELEAKIIISKREVE